MIVSMTGYGRGRQEKGGLSVTVEIKSVNHRFCDISIRLPRQFMIYEEKLKRTVQQYVRRGKVDVFVSIEGDGIMSRTLDTDWDLIEQFFQAFQEVKAKYSINENISLNQLMHLSDVFQIKESDKEIDDMESLLMTAAQLAGEELFQMRKEEGNQLQNDFHNRLTTVAGHVQELITVSNEVANTYKERLLKKVKDFLSGSFEIDESRILTEVAVYADKSDINEELERLKSHLTQFQDILQSKEPIGRKLDFLIQEMNREVNTIGSKSNDIAVSQKVIEMKSEIEKLKEQVQNIE